MLDISKTFRYSQEHEWVNVDGMRATIGITEFAQSELGDIVFVELPSVGAVTQVGDVFGTIESVKTVSDLFAPVSGQVIAINTKLEEAPETVNTDPYRTGWMVVVDMEDISELEQLLSWEDYEALIVED